MNDILLIVGSVILLFWGSAHIIKTKPVVNTFGQLSIDNKRILTMEWITEGMLLIFIALLVILGAVVGLKQSIVFYLSASTLLVMAVLSLATGARTSQLPFRLCPVIFTVSALFIVAGVLL
jgi:uncharacterized membrane protein